MANALRFKHTDVPRQQGEQARFKVVQGPDYGAIYVIVANQATIGRGEDCDIVISDLKASRVHAQVLLGNGGWTIRDKGSANGILYNNTSTRETKLKLNDVITVGETTLEFTTSEVGTQMLVAPPRSMTQIQIDQAQLDARQKKLGSLGLAALFSTTPESQPSISGVTGTKPPQKSKSAILIVAAVLLGGLLMLPDGNQPKKQKKKNDDSSTDRNLASFLPVGEQNKAADALFKDGFREYMAGNYNRARIQFETVLQISPGHPLATVYLENCTRSINDEVKFHMDHGKKAQDAGKLKDARSHYETIIRLLYKDQSNPDFIKAKEYQKKVLQEINAGGIGNS